MVAKEGTTLRISDVNHHFSCALVMRNEFFFLAKLCFISSLAIFHVLQFRFRVSGFGFRVSGLGLGLRKDLGFRVWGFQFKNKVRDLGFRV